MRRPAHVRFSSSASYSRACGFTVTHRVEDVAPERPELQEVEPAPPRDAPLAVEEGPAIGRPDQHVEAHGREDDREHGSE